MKRAFILTYLAVQLVVPATYYFAGRDFDERFAWRMFSPTRVTPCVVEFTTQAGDRAVPVRPQAEVHLAWTELMERSRTSVVEGFGRWECARMRERGEPEVLLVDVRCELPDGRVHRPIPPDRNLCDTP